MVLKDKALGPSVFHLGWQPEEILKRKRLKLIIVILVSPAWSPVYWKEVYAIWTVSKTSKNKKNTQLITPQKNKRNTMPIQQLNSMQTQLCCYISFSINKKKKTKNIFRKLLFTMSSSITTVGLCIISLFSKFQCVCFLFSILWHHVHLEVHHRHGNLLYWVLLFCFSLNTGDSFAMYPCLQPSFPARIDIYYLIIRFPNLLCIPTTSSLTFSPTFTQPDGKKVFKGQYSDASVRSC